MKPQKQWLLNWLQISTWSGKSWEIGRIFTQILHKYCPILDSFFLALRLDFFQNRRTSWWKFLRQCLSEEELSFRQSLTDLQWQPVAQSLVLQSSSWRIVEDCPDTSLHAKSRLQLCFLVEARRPSCRFFFYKKNHCCAMNWLLSRFCRCSERLSGTFAHAGKYRIHNRRRNWQIALNECGVGHDADQSCQLCPPVSCEWSFCEDVCQLLCCVAVFDLNHWM